MTPKEKAQELVDKFKDYVHGYIGSSMLVNHEYPEQILSQAKKCAIIAVDEIIKSKPIEPKGYTSTIGYWDEVKQEIDNL